ncbi:Cadherin-related family member 4 [Gossypium arboreum]|uniref:Cadherin-related family member 4 n=1 Tax=Gossypium arboreum TaxID=29729 RepID=A0A0B0NB87_GOSAR|nr:Cadherin-related family member 4 [Gossypium arboreum]
MPRTLSRPQTRVGEKAKIAKVVKCAERQNRDRGRGKNKRDSEPSSSVQRPKKNARADGPIRAGPSTLSGRVLEKYWGVLAVWSTTSEVTVLSPLGQSVRVTKLYRDVPLELQGAIFLADLIELPFWEFNLILRMDWLVKHRVNLDCATKRVVVRTEEDNEELIKGVVLNRHCDCAKSWLLKQGSGGLGVLTYQKRYQVCTRNAENGIQ